MFTLKYLFNMFKYLFNKRYFTGILHMPRIVLGTGDTAVNKMEKILDLMAFFFL